MNDERYVIWLKYALGRELIACEQVTCRRPAEDIWIDPEDGRPSALCRWDLKDAMTRKREP